MQTRPADGMGLHSAPITVKKEAGKDIKSKMCGVQDAYRPADMCNTPPLSILISWSHNQRGQ